MDQTFVRVPSDVERPASEGVITRRTLDTNSVLNQKALNFLQAIVDKDYATDLEFDDLPEIGREDIVALLSQLIIRFDTKPDYYTKKDYQLLIGVLTGALTYLYNNSGSESDIAELLEIINEFKLWVENNYVPEEGFEERVNELIEAALPDIPQPLPQKQITYTEGSGIDISASDSDTRVVSAVLTEPITVSNVSIGGYSNGMVILEDTPIVDILKTILQKVVDVVAVEPSVKLTGTNKSVEYGSSVTSNLTISLTQGYFKPANDSWVANNQNMCYKITGAPSSTWTILTNGMSAKASDTLEVTSSITYSGYTVNVAEENTTIPKKSNGDDSSVRCSVSSLTTSGSVTITPYYYLFFGPVDTSDITTITSATVRNLTQKKAFFPLSNLTISELYNGGGKSILVACPTAYSLTDVTDSMGNSILELFLQKHKLNIPCGNLTVEYNLYLYPITNGADQAYKNLTFNLV